MYLGHVPLCSVSSPVCHRRLPSSNCFLLSGLSLLSFISPHLLKTHEEHSNIIVAFTKSPDFETSTKSPTAVTMCIQVVERYAACRCIYYRHATDPCSSYNQRGHRIVVKEVSVGYKCSRHSVSKSYTSSQQYHYSDSGYGSGSSSRPRSGGFRR